MTLADEDRSLTQVPSDPRCAYEHDLKPRCGPVRYRVRWYLYGGATKSIKVCGKHVLQHKYRHGYAIDELTIDGKVRCDSGGSAGPRTATGGDGA